MQTKKTALAFLVLLVLLSSLGLSGCANQPKSEAGALLTQDYRKMDNDELTLYYYRLTEEIDRTERSGSGSALSIGIAVSSTKLRSMLPVSPSRSVADKCSVWGPSERLPPASPAS